MKQFFKKKWVKRTLFLVIVAGILVGVLHSLQAPVSYRTTRVERGDVAVTVSGTGTIAAVEARKEISKVAARVEAIYFQEGDTVQKGDVIAKLDSSDFEMTVKTQQNSVQQAQLSKQNADRQVNKLKILATSDGFVSHLNIAEGSYVVTNTKVCDITVPSKYEITLQFLSSETNRITVGSPASIFLTESYSYIDGVVTYVGSEKQVLKSGSTVIDVIITVENPNYVLGGLKANASVVSSSGATMTSLNDSTFSSATSAQILSGSTGTVVNLLVKEGSEVKYGDVIAELENADLAANAQSSALSLQNMYQQLEYSQDQLEDYAISASMDGTITAQSIKVGDWVSTGSLISTISNMGTFEFLIPVDELDISKLTLENPVWVTIDALSDTIDHPIEGKITKLPLEGVAVGGVTDYYVTIHIPYIEGLRIAMNASADITVQESLDTLRVPVECVSKEAGKYYVEVVQGETVEKKEVTVGIQNSSYYEILEGLEEDEEIILPQQNTFSLFS